MSTVNGPITVTIEILGSFDTEALGKFLALLHPTALEHLHTDRVMISVNWGDN